MCPSIVRVRSNTWPGFIYCLGKSPVATEVPVRGSLFNPSYRTTLLTSQAKP